ncbi:MAG: Acyl-CoA dehydrogenase [Alphaproteobacteria bacterium MarineAlpha3_Bin7]|nr:MAG: Acyl-CoA dehydrogenase [Alphaproteobacteria bacterium MarineAlpha3_Bin7]
MSDLTYMEWPFFDDSHREFAEKLRDWAIKEIQPLENKEPNGNEELDHLCREFVKKLGIGGWLQYCIPSSHGGALESFDVRTLALTREILGYYSGLADFSFAMQGLGSGAITLFGSEEQKDSYLPKVASGERIGAFAISEASGGSDVAAMKTTAELSGNEYCINGSKTWISNAGIADFYVLFARTNDAPGSRGISAFVINSDTPGLSISERINVIAPHPLGTLEFKNCKIPTTNMIGNSGEGFKVAMSTLDVFRTTVGGASLGFAKRALDEAITRSKEREAFGKSISEFQLIQAKIADMAVKIDAMALLIYRSAWTKDKKATRVTRESSMAKLYGTEAAQEVIDQAVQIFGGMGVVSGVKVEQLYREIRALRIYEGTSEIQKLVIAGQTLGN